MNTSTAEEKLKSVAVKGLFRRFNHEIIFAAQDDIIIVTAPNGHGKTVMLRIVDSLFNRKLHFFWKLTFEEIHIQLFSGKAISIFKDTGTLFPEEERQRPEVRIKSTGFGHDEESYELSPALHPSDMRYFERHFPVERIGPDHWRDYSVDRTLRMSDLVELYADRLPEKILQALKLPEWLQLAFSCVNSHLIETQRLLSIEEVDDPRPNYRRDRVTTASVVEKDASDLSSRIGRVLQEYANEAQKLDQSFPKRIIELHDVVVPVEADIRKQLEELNRRRDELVSAGLIGKTISEPIKPSDRFSEEQVRKILSIYIDDTKSKLSVFDEIYSKIRLFQEILNEHFSFKEIRIDPKHGIMAVDKDSEKEIPLSELSSGEQHELVLIYELLFKVEESSLILIDEPELSLHVAWQKRFVSDLQKIQSLKPLEVIIATHSPQIINDRWDLVQDLKA
ncbi:MAG: AAA family ATPase [Pseudomonadota bacterium]